MVDHLPLLFHSFHLDYSLDSNYDADLIDKIRDILEKAPSTVTPSHYSQDLRITNQNYIKDSFKHLSKILLENINNEYKHFTKTKEFVSILTEIEFLKLQHKFSEVFETGSLSEGELEKK